MPRQRQRSPRTWTTTSRGRACGGARAEQTPTSHGSRATTARAPTTARAAATSMHPSQAAVAACEGKHLPGVNGSPPTSRRGPRSLAHAAPDELSSWGAPMQWWTDTRDLRGDFQGTKRAIGGASRSELAMNNGPFPEKWPRTMVHSNQWAKEMGHFPKNGLEQWPISRRWQTGVAHVAQTARRLRQARRQQEPQLGSAMTCCAPHTHPLHPDVTVVAIDYPPAVVGVTSRQRKPWTRSPVKPRTGGRPKRALASPGDGDSNGEGSGRRQHQHVERRLPAPANRYALAFGRVCRLLYTCQIYTDRETR
jgi:hypothetical protein